MTKYDKLVKSSKFRHAPASAGAGSAKAGILNELKILDSRLHGNDARRRFMTFYENIKILMPELPVDRKATIVVNLPIS